MIKILLNVLYGFIIGALMLLPGVSGGTTAIILGIYDKIVSAVSSFRKNIKKNLIFLGTLALGGGIGVLLLAKPLETLVGLWYGPLCCLFGGLTMGSVPMLLKKTGAKLNLKDILKVALWLVVGAAIVVGIEFMPEDMLTLGDSGILRFVLLFVLGIIFSVGFVLPGISLSYLMLVFGVYTPLLAAVSGLDIMFLLPLALGILVGTVLTTKLLETCMNKHPLPTYTVITGFVAGSVVALLMNDIIPNLPWTDGWYNIPVCVALFAVGFAGVFFYTSRHGLD
ncbi:MAG: DUF368 domain-containing protein [Ruminococcaceae bacterium]|nr:DUF368 domain-containing protein [Oscillospiraceae bacterium]